MTNDQLKAIGLDEKWLQPLIDVFAKYDISTPKRQASFIGQCQHESGNFKILEENLHYKPDRLHIVFPSRFPTVESALPFDTPEKIANKIYGGRMGNLEDGDGWKYHGRGLIQLTGRDNYKSFSDSSGIDAINNPDLLLQPEYACLSAGWYWNKRNLNMAADANDYKTMTQRINGGLIGLDDRIAKIQSVEKILGGS
jgi:putative chitinase